GKASAKASRIRRSSKRAAGSSPNSRIQLPSRSGPGETARAQQAPADKNSPMAIEDAAIRLLGEFERPERSVIVAPHQPTIGFCESREDLGAAGSWLEEHDRGVDVLWRKGGDWCGRQCRYHQGNGNVSAAARAV